MQVVADIEVGTGNLANLQAAQSIDSAVVVEERPFADRNYAGDDARSAYESLCAQGVVVRPDEVLSVVSNLIESPGRPAR